MAMTPAEVMGAVYAHMRKGEWDEAEKYVSDDFILFEPESLPYGGVWKGCLLYTSPSPRDKRQSRMPSSA